MAKRKSDTDVEKTSPKYPYTISPGDLRRLLELIPTKPKPTALTKPVAKTWGIKNNNVSYAITVLREIGLVDANGTPSEAYVGYMTKGVAGAALGQKIKERYKLLFESHQAPQNATDEDLRNFFNINSGGAQATINYQIRTFKTLCEFATFDGTYKAPKPGSNGIKDGDTGTSSTIHFDFHLHLPEGKTVAEYEAIIESVSKNIIAKIRS